MTTDAPSEVVILAARHLDATEGPVQIGSTVDTATRSAITTVLRYIAKAHNSPDMPGNAAPPPSPDGDTVTRVADLHEQWVKAGAPPLGTSMSRWWDARLVELRAALYPPPGAARRE